MTHLVPTALALFLLTIAAGRLWARRSLALLSVEEKACAMEVLARGHVWPFVSLAAAVAIIDWMPGDWIPGYYRPGVFGLFLAVPFFVSLGSGVGHSMRLARAGLPRAYRRSVRFQTIAFHVAFLVLLGTLFYVVYSVFSQGGH